jgi:hypothetical protein
MPITNIEFINYSDGQDLSIDKLNHNFDEVVEYHGGSIGETGPSGDRGPIGANGQIGPTGNQGQRGTRWFIQGGLPSGPGDSVIYGDYWVDSDDGTINIFGPSGWTDTGYNLSASGSLFSDIESNFTNGGTGVSVRLDQITPENYTFIISDKSPQSGIINEKLAKFLISTDTSGNPSPVLEFMKSDLNIGVDYAKHPIMTWASSLLTDNTLKFDIPDGSLLIGASGGFNSNSQSFEASAGNIVDINYGVTSGSGISATGGIQVVTSSPSGTFSILSDNLSITGGHAAFKSNVGLNGSPSGTVPSISLKIGGTAGLRTERTADTFNTLSNSVYNVSLETLGSREFYINTKGKIRTKKTRSGVTYQSYQNTAFNSLGSNWYFISRNGGPVQSTVIRNGNTVIITPIDPGDPGEFIGIGLYNDPLYSWWGPGSIEPGQSIDISVYCSPDLPSGSKSLFKYIGVGTTSGATLKVTLPSPAVAVDFTITKGVTGGNTTVYYKAYTTAGGSGGSFVV